MAVRSSVRSGGRVSTRGVTVTLVGMPEVKRALEELARMGSRGYTAVIGTDIVDPPYPFFLEYGTRRMRPYPAARPAFDEMKGVAQAAVADFLGQLIAGGQRDPSIIEAAVREGARPIENRWKELARYETGAYRQSVHTETVEGVE